MHRTANEARRQRMLLQNAEQMQQIHHKQRHDALLQAVASRAPVLREEADHRDTMAATFRRSIVEIHQWVAKSAAATARNDAIHARLSDNVARVVAIAIDHLDRDGEAGPRRAVELLEEKCRLAVRRVMAHEAFLIECVAQQRRCFDAERRIRETHAANEQRLRDEAQLDYSKKPWAPHLQLFGVCPFHNRRDCPFANARKSRIDVDPLHFRT